MKKLSTSMLASSLGAILLSALGESLLGADASAQTPTISPQDIERASPPPDDGANRVSTVGQGVISLCPFAASTIPVTINRVEIAGSTVLTEDDVRKSYAGIEGRPTTLAAVCDIRERLIVSYRRAGYPLTRVELPEQRIGAEGVIRFNAVEASLASVRVTDNAQSPRFANVVDGFAKELTKSTQGQPLKWAAVERFALLMRDTPGLVARLELRPGAVTPEPLVAPVVVAPNEAAAPVQTPPAVTPAELAPLDLFVTLEPPERYGAFMSIQRNSADVFGRYAGVVGGQIRGVMPWGGDELSAVLYSTQTGRQAVGQVAYEWRHGNGFTLRASAAYAETKPGKSFAPLDLKGQSVSYNLNASYPFVLRSAYQLEGVTGLDYVDQDNFIFEDQSISNDRVRVSYTRLNALWRDVEQRRARASASVEYRQGMKAFDASRPGDPFLSRLDAQPQAGSWRVRAEGEYRLRRNYPGVALAGDAQFSDKVLVSYEQYQVGNLTFGRGYDPGTITGDRGYGGRVELLGGRYQPQGYDQLYGEPYAFYDAARVERLSIASTEPELDVASYGGGLRFRYGDRASFDIGAAQALDRPGRDQKKPGAQFLMNLTIQF
ncbi:MAG: ShlB/FhaC/HecB family hemolysin secretion/activation protein [Hyphomonadaceae bacterium]|nr:ShlB/FhaC/HecB family hemolysin secretion/activation protein [Hyphomonadaceae bacterium]